MHSPIFGNFFSYDILHTISILKWLTILWVLVSSTSKVSNGCIRDLWFNPAYTKNWLVSWSSDKELSSRADTIDWNSLKKKWLTIFTLNEIQLPKF